MAIAHTIQDERFRVSMGEQEANTEDSVSKIMYNVMWLRATELPKIYQLGPYKY
jgi:hypothetical protein